MSKRRFFSRLALAVASTAVIAACSSDTPTSPMTASPSLAAVAPAIGLSPTTFRLCYPGGGSTRVCWPSGSLSISNAGGGTLNWTATKSKTWLKISPRLGTAPSTMKVWVDPTGLLRGTYSGRITVWATGATNSPRTVVVYFTRR
jgi:hypothetical protein